ncbi:uncharacterized protein LOC134182838 [Corticium candelabrum]|uniref:uncharacterized protein LOC134182838 n=1 Tax=Corticium candelabrum TaxID=121492 RepID=UPI002E26C8B1|nr:uncharacterized protein LOC134182838 [Corticium candelabrum]
MAIPLKYLAAAQVVRYHGATLAEFPANTHQALGVQWLRVRMHPNGKDFIVDHYTLSPNKVISIAATFGHAAMVPLARKLGSTHIQEAMNMAAYGGHEHVVRLCYNYGDMFDPDEVMERAAEGGHEHVAHLCRKLGATDLNRAILWPQVVVSRTSCVFVAIGVTKFDMPMAWATDTGHEHIARLCHEWGATNFHMSMRWAASGGHESIARLCRDWGPPTSTRLWPGPQRGHENLVRLCHEWGATGVDNAMICAADKGHESIVRLCRELGAVDIDATMAQAAGKGYVDIVILCLEWGASDLKWAIACARNEGYEDIVRLCRRWSSI